MWIYGSIVFLCYLTVQGEEECDPGKYGDACSQNCSQNCKPLPSNIVLCHKETGECFEGCKAGVYGDLCNEPCSKNCQELICNQHNGHCALGCIENHIGDFCETSRVITTVHQGTTYSSHTTFTTSASPTNSSQVNIPVAVAVPVLILILILVGAVVIFIWRRKKEKKKKKENEDDAEAGQSCLGGSPQDGQDTQDRSCMEAKLMKEIQEMKDMMMSMRRPGAPQPSDSSGILAPTLTSGRRYARADHDLYDDLYVAYKEGNLAEVKRILDTGWVDVTSRGRLGMTQVMMAARRGHREVVEFLVSQGADVSLVDEVGDNTLHYACFGGDRKTVEFVLSQDWVDVNSRGLGSSTPVMMAARWGNRDVVELLVSQGADVSLVNDDGDNILHWACLEGDRKTVEFVLSLDGVDINRRGWKSRTPVMWAALEGHRDVLELLVSRGADVSLVDDDGDNILHCACLGGNRKTVEFVLSLDGVDINVRNNDRQTAADVARDRQHNQLSDLLVSRGTQ